MSTSIGPKNLTRALAGATLALSTAMLGACIVTPAPQRVYEPAPPPPPAAPAAEPEPENTTIQASEPPPPLPDYAQPPCPADGYLWTPGYWAWGGAGYYWVPGTWVQPPRVGVLWTPGYWAFVGGVYAFHAGYWGPHVGFYGGVNYGYGYTGVGFVGGRWAGNSYAYNTNVNNVNVTNVHNTYNETVINNVTVNKVSYNGGAGGVVAAPTERERMYARDPHVAPTPLQREHVQEASRNPTLAATANGGHPAIAATPRPAAFTAPGVVAAHSSRGLPPGQAMHAGMQGGLPPGQAMHTGSAPNGMQGMHPQPGAPAAVMHPQAGAPPAAVAHPQAPRPAQQQAAKPPKNEKHDHEHEQGNGSR
jgi:hypothetical protein